MRRIDRRCLGQSLKVFPRYGDRAQTTNELHAHSLFHLLGLAQKNRAYLACAVHVGSAACVQVKVANVDQTQLFASRWRNLADSHGLRFFRRGVANLDGTFFGDNFIRETFSSVELLCADLVSCQINGAVFVAHVKRDGREVVQALEGRRQYVLSRVLLHMVATALGVDHAMNRYAGPQPTWRTLDKMPDVTRVLLLLNVDDSHARAVGNGIDDSSIGVLATAGGIEG